MNILLKRSLSIGIFAACLFFYTITAHAFPVNQCLGSRAGSFVNCNANDVSITGMRVVGDFRYCIAGQNITLDLELTINFQVPDRWDIGIFISNDGKDPKLRISSGGAASCSVSVLPNSSPFLDLDSNGGTDTCGDGNGTIGGGTGSGIHYMPNVTVPCQALAGSGGKLYIPFAVSWDNQKTPPGDTCTSNADPVANTVSKCNSPTIGQGTVQVVVMPTVTINDGIAFIQSGSSTSYTVVITNNTGDTLTNAVFTDPAVTGIAVNSVSCSGASCPAPAFVTVGAMQGAGITIPSMPAGSSVTFTINATLTGTPPDTRTNTASVTVGGQTNSASDTDTIVGTIAINPSTLSKYGTQSTSVVYTYTLYNFGVLSDTISLSSVSSQGWPVSLSASSITVPAGGSATYTVTVQIPAGTAIGTVDTTTITATSGNNPANTAKGYAVTTVEGPLTFTPNNTGSGGKGSSVYYDHRVQNNTASSQTVTFSTALSGTCTGWTAVPPVSVTLAPFGGYADVVVRVNISGSAATGSSCTATTTATAGNTASATDITTVRDLILYSDPGFTDESYIYPVENFVYAKVFGLTNGLKYQFRWYDPSGTLKRTSPVTSGVGTSTYDSYQIPLAGPLGQWRVEVWDAAGSAIVQGPVYFNVGPDHLKASYTGANTVVNNNATVSLALHAKDHASTAIQGAQLITVTVSGSASIVSTTLSGAVITGQTVTGTLAADGTASITITDAVAETVTITPHSTTLYGSKATPDRDEPATVNFIMPIRARIIDWREVVQ